MSMLDKYGTWDKKIQPEYWAARGKSHAHHNYDPLLHNKTDFHWRYRTNQDAYIKAFKEARLTQLLEGRTNG